MLMAKIQANLTAEAQRSQRKQEAMVELGT
jgi:hypothetical protein